ncbi:MAG: HAD family hydrolase [Alphaproteobacteria bacterium]|nr:HAD family hydrolase [Alphaproteobacteria bacterium]
MNKSKALLLDRDGVINEDTGYIGTVEAFSFLPGVFPFLREVRARGYRLTILTNQAGVARGFYTIDDYERLTSFMLERFREEAIEIDLILACFEHEKGVLPIHARQSFWRKPSPGMVLEAIRSLHLDPVRSAFIGDKLTDMEAAIAGGIGRRLWFTQEDAVAPEGTTFIRSHAEALKYLL